MLAAGTSVRALGKITRSLPVFTLYETGETRKTPLRTDELCPLCPSLVGR